MYNTVKFTVGTKVLIKALDQVSYITGYSLWDGLSYTVRLKDGRQFPFRASELKVVGQGR